MTISVIIHIANEDPILGELDALPGAGSTTIIVNNPRRRDGKDLHYLQDNVTTVLWPLDRVSFIEILSSEIEDTVITPWRE
ncbi:MAG: hypothetical protein JXA19_01505 [Anaerolineales bacterium]|nr:hypothetical protein [Anaerolineales bacterium]